MTIAFVALVLAVVACIGFVGLAAYCWWDYRMSRAAGEIVERARQVMAPTQFPSRRGTNPPPEFIREPPPAPPIPAFRRKPR